MPRPFALLVLIALTGLLAGCLNAEPDAPPRDLPPSSQEAPQPRAASAAPPAQAAPPQPTVGAEWTILIYMAADNNLEPAARYNLNQIGSVGSTEQVRVVVQVDRRGGAQRLYAEKGSFRVLGDLGEIDMSDPGTLREFIAWGSRAYPARRYALVLWDHGAGWEGYALDDSAGKEQPMALTELAGALRQGGVRFDFLGFDACLMGSAEVALALHPYARVLVASQELVPGRGWDYTAMLEAVTRNPGITGSDLGRAVAAGYLAALRQKVPRQSLYATLSVIDLSQMPQVAAALTRFVAALDAYVLADTQDSPAERLARLGQVIGRARFETPAFGRTSATDPGRAFDLGLLAKNAARVTGDGRVMASAADLQAAIAAAVTHAVAGDGRRETPLSGLSLFLPVYGNLPAAYGTLPAVRESRWADLVRILSDAASQDRVAPTVAGPATDAAVVIPGRRAATVTGQVTDDVLVTGVVAGVVAIDGQTPLLVELSEQPRSYRAANDYSFTFAGLGWYLADGQSRQLVFSVRWQPGRRAVFGRYQQAPGARPTDAYFVYDEATGDLIEGFEAVGGALAALLPAAESRFHPFLYTPDLKPVPAAAVAVGSTTLRQGPLPDGLYLLTVTGFDLGDNAATEGVLVVVQGR